MIANFSLRSESLASAYVQGLVNQSAIQAI